MGRDKLSKVTKLSVIFLGIFCLAISLISMPYSGLGSGFLALLLFAAVLAPRMTLTMPRSSFAISFSDAAVFVSFFVYGGQSAVLIAAVETLSNCLYLRSKKFPFGRLMIPTNVSINVLSVSITYVIWLNIFQLGLITAEPGSTRHLLASLSTLAIIHFLVSSSIASLFHALKDWSNVWETWKRDCFTSSMTQIVGAGLAGIIMKVISFGDVVTALIAFAIIGIAYLSYRQSIGEVVEAIDQVEAAEREKAEVERDRRLEAEKHSAQLALSLEKEERANDALRKSEIDLQHAALHDPLTTLPNRKHFSDSLKKMIAAHKNDPNQSFHVLFLDLRKFKNINDSLGHTLGDKVLIVAGKRFVRMLNAGDMVARIGGDEFAVILRGLSNTGKAQKVARRIYDNITQPFSLSGNRISIGVNIGVAPGTAEYETPEELLRDADIAMHYAKEWNSGVAVFTKELRDRFLERVRYEGDLSNAIERNELSMSYQPLIDIQNGGIMGFEALLRWNHTEFGNIPPNKFIPIAEESGLIIPITNWILKQTTCQLAAWQKISPQYRDLIVSVNISGKHLSKDDLIKDVEDALRLSKISPSTLKLEITESSAMENAEHTITVLNRLKSLGVQLSIDDFGTGYSSLSYLHRLPFDTLKIDRSFVYSVGERGENSEILQTIISLAKNLKKKVIAEGIETEAQLSLLRNLGCDYGQGYLMSRPQTVANAEKALYQRKSWLPDNNRESDSAPNPIVSEGVLTLV